MSKSNITQKVLETIEEKEITPRSLNYFVIKNLSVWVLSISSLVIGALAVSVIIFRFSNAGALFFERGRFEILKTILTLIPLVWFIALTLFGYLALREFRHTKRGYRYKFSTLLGVVVLTSVLLGGALYSFGSGYVLDRFTARHMPFHRDIEALFSERWQQPDAGFITGTVLERGDENFVLEDLDEEIWQIILHNDIDPMSLSVLEQYIEIRVRGEKLGEDSFLACRIMPWQLHGRGLFKSGPPRRSFSDKPFRKPFFNSERKLFLMRTNGCEGVRPYDTINN